MILKELIERLENEDQDKVVRNGFKEPHSDRGDYYSLAFEPAYGVKVSDMLKDTKSALGTTYTGWKGGAFEMGEYTDCYLAERGHTGQEIGSLLLEYMLNDVD